MLVYYENGFKMKISRFRMEENFIGIKREKTDFKVWSLRKDFDVLKLFYVVLLQKGSE